MKLRDIVELSGVLKHLANQPMSATTSYKLVRNAAIIEPIVKSFDTQRLELFEKLREQKETDQYTIKPENEEVFRKEFDQLLNVDEHLELKKIKLKELESMIIPPIQMVFLQLIIEE